MTPSIFSSQYHMSSSSLVNLSLSRHLIISRPSFITTVAFSLDVLSNFYSSRQQVVMTSISLPDIFLHAPLSVEVSESCRWWNALGDCAFHQVLVSPSKYFSYRWMCNVTIVISSSVTHFLWDCRNCLCSVAFVDFCSHDNSLLMIKTWLVLANSE